MKPGEKGFTLIELLISLAITALIAVAASTVIFQIFRTTDRNNNYMTAVRQVQNASYWLNHDFQMADGITTNTTPPDFLTIRWSEWDAAGTGIYHSANYTFENLSSSIGNLKRTHRSSAGDNDTKLIATGIYFNPDDADNTTRISYQSPVLTVRLTALSENTRETREYEIKCRPNY